MFSCSKHSYLYEYLKINAKTGDTIVSPDVTNSASEKLFLLKSNRGGFYFTNALPKYDTFKLSKRCDTCIDKGILNEYKMLVLKEYRGKYQFTKEHDSIFYMYSGLTSKRGFKFKHYIFDKKNIYNTFLPFIDEREPTLAYTSKYLKDTTLNILNTKVDCYIFEERPNRVKDTGAKQIYYLSKRELLPVRIERKSSYENVYLYWHKKYLCKHCDSIANIEPKNKITIYVPNG